MTTTLETTLEKETETVLTKAYEGERCDADGAQAFWLVYFDGKELAWCNHHYMRFQAKFADKKTIKILP